VGAKELLEDWWKWVPTNWWVVWMRFAVNPNNMALTWIREKPIGCVRELVGLWGIECTMHRIHMALR